MANSHSLSDGGAAALFASGIYWITIQRWGRWRTFIFHEYVWHDSMAFLHLGERIASTKGLQTLLVDVAPLHVRQTTSESTPFHTGASRSGTLISCRTTPSLSPLRKGVSEVFTPYSCFGRNDASAISLLRSHVSAPPSLGVILYSTFALCLGSSLSSLLNYIHMSGKIYYPRFHCYNCDSTSLRGSFSPVFLTDSDCQWSFIFLTIFSASSYTNLLCLFIQDHYPVSFGSSFSLDCNDSAY